MEHEKLFLLFKSIVSLVKPFAPMFKDCDIAFKNKYGDTTVTMTVTMPDDSKFSFERIIK